jgi:hypothetical protein
MMGTLTVIPAELNEQGSGDMDTELGGHIPFEAPRLEVHLYGAGERN